MMTSIDLQSPVLWIVILVFLTPVVIGLGIIFRRQTAIYWIRRFRAKAENAGCSIPFERSLNYRIDQAHDGRRQLEYGDIRSAYEEAMESAIPEPLDVTVNIGDNQRISGRQQRPGTIQINIGKTQRTCGGDFYER
ncbi:MAG: hypothetical protein ACYCZ6_18265 [Polaromonas sp.]